MKTAEHRTAAIDRQIAEYQRELDKVKGSRNPTRRDRAERLRTAIAFLLVRGTSGQSVDPTGITHDTGEEDHAEL